MSRKEFAYDARGYVLMGDARDVAVSYDNRQAVYDWAGQQGMTVEYQGTLGGTDLWRIRNEQDRAWFIMRWA